TLANGRDVNGRPLKATWRDQNMSTRQPLNPGLKLVLDLGPLAVFFLAYTRPNLFSPLLAPFLPDALITGAHAGIFSPAPIFIRTVVLALIVSFILTRHLPLMPVVTATVVIVFGGLTLIFQDETFIKMKPTIVYVLFASVLLGGLAFGKSLLGLVLDSVFQL